MYRDLILDPLLKSHTLMVTPTCSSATATVHKGSSQVITNNLPNSMDNKLGSQLTNLFIGCMFTYIVPSTVLIHREITRVLLKNADRLGKETDGP